MPEEEKEALIVPTFGDEKFIGRVLPIMRKWVGEKPKSRITYVVIDGVVNPKKDHREDGTVKLVVASGVPYIFSGRGNPKRNMGKGGAVKTGLKRVLSEGAKYIALADADSVFRADHINSMIEPLKTGEYDMVIARRANSIVHPEFDMDRLNGERAIRHDIEEVQEWLKNPGMDREMKRYGFETGLNNKVRESRVLMLPTDITSEPPGKGNQKKVAEIASDIRESRLAHRERLKRQAIKRATRSLSKRK